MSQAVPSRDQLPAGEAQRFIAYLAVVIIAGFAVLGVALSSGGGPLPALVGLPGFWIVLVLIVVGEVRPLFLPGVGDPSGVATSTPFAFAALLAYGLPAAALMHVTATVITGITRRHAWWRTAFNAAQYTLSIAAAWGVLALGGYPADATSPYAPAVADLPIILAAMVVYFIVNDVLVVLAVALQSHASILGTLKEDFLIQGFVTAATTGISPMIAVAMVTRPWVLGLVVLPLAALYFNAAVSVAREREARVDLLTGLANRAALVQQTEQAISVRSSSGPAVALLLMDLDRFKEVNDTLGHPVGDQVLQVVAERIAGARRAQDVVARLGGDEFAVLLTQVNGAEAAVAVAQRIRVSLETPIHVDNVDVDLGVSIGIALYPEHGDTFDLLHRRADVAMYLAKAGPHGVEVYDPQRDHNSPQRLGLVAALRRSLAHGELEVHYQPRLHLSDGGVSGMEALVRWHQPSRGYVPPAEFLPLAERSGLMPAVTEAVLTAAVRQLAQWRADGLDLTVGVNVSVRDLIDPRFVDQLLARLDSQAVLPAALTLEVTERALGHENARGVETLRRARAAGLGVSLDDFGTGHSSLTMLARLPVTEIKIDRSFVSGVERLGTEGTIIRSLVDLAHALQLAVVAEGVEQPSTLEALAALGCDEVQGWAVARPMAAEEATRWLRGHSLHPLGAIPRPRNQVNARPVATADPVGFAGPDTP